MTTYNLIVILSWIVFIFVWIISAFNVKRDIRGGYSYAWKQYWRLRTVAAMTLLIFFAVRLISHTAHFTNSRIILDHGVFSSIFIPSLFLGWIGALLSVFGVTIAIWARFSLGRNWSPRPAIKEKHELVTTGPYAYVRHPIYSGLIVTAFGTLLIGAVFGVMVLTIACVIFLLRIKKEEQIMLGLFPNEYAEYKKKTWALIPFVW